MKRETGVLDPAAGPLPRVAHARGMSPASRRRSQKGRVWSAAWRWRLLAGGACVLLVFALLGGCVRSSAAQAYGPAPEFAGIEGWLNTPPQSMERLRGEVVLVQFWTHGCSSCRHALPHTERWHRRYGKRGLVVVGIHTPETEEEAEVPGLQAAIQELGLTFPVALDNGYGTWDAYDNQYWPAHYLVDRDGDIVLKHVGEGDYAETEAAIVALLDD